jgi:hypothetical protein
MGRFTSVDPAGSTGANLERPQMWNGYSYAINNPIVYSDPNGLKVKVCDTSGNCVEISDSDANRYLYNKKYQKQSGFYTTGNGNIYDTQGKVIGTYENISCDACSYQGDQLVYRDLPRYLSDPKVIIAAAISGSGRYLARPVKPPNLPSARKVTVDMEEVISGHTSTGVRYLQGLRNPNTQVLKDIFPDTMNAKQIESAVLDAYAHSERISTQGERVVVRGVTRDGMIIEMVINTVSKVIETAYPKGTVK